MCLCFLGADREPGDEPVSPEDELETHAEQTQEAEATDERQKAEGTSGEATEDQGEGPDLAHDEYVAFPEKETEEMVDRLFAPEEDDVEGDLDENFDAGSSSSSTESSDSDKEDEEIKAATQQAEEGEDEAKNKDKETGCFGSAVLNQFLVAFKGLWWCWNY